MLTRRQNPLPKASPHRRNEPSILDRIWSNTAPDITGDASYCVNTGLSLIAGKRCGIAATGGARGRIGYASAAAGDFPPSHDVHRPDCRMGRASRRPMGSCRIQYSNRILTRRWVVLDQFQPVPEPTGAAVGLIALFLGAARRPARPRYARAGLAVAGGASHGNAAPALADECDRRGRRLAAGGCQRAFGRP